MDFALAEGHQAVAELAAHVLAEIKADPWKELARSGLLALSLPTALGGDGLGVLETALLLTETGRRAVPVPALATLMTGALPLVRWGSEELQRSLLPAVGAGELILTAAIREPSDPLPGLPATTLADGTISGTKIGVPYAAEAARILVPARIQAGSCVVLIDPATEGVTLTRTPGAGPQPEYTVRMDRVPAEDVLGPAACVQDLYRLAVAGACAVADGAVAGALALTRDHVATRHQFGRPLAAFQAVSQQIADVYIASRTLHLTTLSACWRLAEGRDPAADLDLAGYWCTTQAPPAVRTCHHLHGGTGMDVSYPLHRYSALVSDLVRFLGGAAYRLERQACSWI
jgi:alkylation response protein AidB-like acyl-CoA dehydrogenase